jgi:diacylglycerol kinase (ATP)
VTTAELVLLIVAVAVSVVAVTLAVLLHRAHLRARLRHVDTSLPFADDVELRPRIAIVVNPTKVDLPFARRTVAAICAEAGWAAPTWLPTTAEDPGEGQTKEAVQSGADVVCAFGGDGTVRVVGAGLAGTGVPLGVLPAGTGNLLARNLGLPLDDLSAAVRVALSGRDMPVDVGRCRLDASGEDEDPRELAFLVMAGLGFDAAIMADVEEALKERLGYFAYVAAGARNLRGAQMRVRLTYDDDEPISRRVRTVLAGNVGRIGGGITLMPDARIDDGVLDTLTLSPRGVVGWTAVAGRVLTRRRTGHKLVEHRRCQRLHITIDEPQPVQVDGDVVAKVRSVDISLDPLALIVRMPDPGTTPPDDPTPAL